MTQRQHRRRRGALTLAALAALVVALGGVGALALTPRVADHFGYARPVADGLPARVTYHERDYAKQNCFSQAQLVARSEWPLTRAGSIPALFAGARAILLPPQEVARPDLTPTGLYIADGPDCYRGYALEGGP